jgi:hypothetical protein
MICQSAFRQIAQTPWLRRLGLAAWRLGGVPTCACEEEGRINRSTSDSRVFFRRPNRQTNLDRLLDVS